MIVNDVAISVMLESLGLALDGGYIRIYDSDKVLLAQLSLGTPAFRFENGVLNATPISPETDAKENGVAASFEVVNASQTDVFFQGNIGIELKLDRTDIRKGDLVGLSSFSFSSLEV